MALMRGDRIGGFQPRRSSTSGDPLIVWARKTDPAYRDTRKWYEDNIQSVQALEGKKLAAARFAVYGKGDYPDATFTLRLSFGKVAGYEEGTTRVSHKTNFHGLYGRGAAFDHQPPFNIAARVLEARSRLDLATPLDFVTTNDTKGILEALRVVYGMGALADELVPSKPPTAP